MIKFIRNFIYYSHFIFSKTFNKTVRDQMKNPNKIPIIIISYNQLENLRKMIDFFLNRGFKNIVIIDNSSTYPPLLEYFNEMKNSITIEQLDSNKGHRAFFDTRELVFKYGKGFYFLSDPDIIPNPNLPKNFASIILNELIKNYTSITKVGFALDIENIPDSYPYKEKVVSWEKKYWEKEIKPNYYLADLDTSFALYKPLYPKLNMSANFYKAIRIAGDFTAEHMGWYINPQNYTEEQIYYFKNANKSASWKLNEQGTLVGYKKDY